MDERKIWLQCPVKTTLRRIWREQLSAWRLLRYVRLCSSYMGVTVHIGLRCFTGYLKFYESWFYAFYADPTQTKTSIFKVEETSGFWVGSESFFCLVYFASSQNQQIMVLILFPTDCTALCGLWRSPRWLEWNSHRGYWPSLQILELQVFTGYAVLMAYCSR